MTAITLIISLYMSMTPLKEQVPVIKDFDINKYSGLWYEIARIDHWFEKNLEYTTALYTLTDKGLTVTNSGYNVKKGKWSSAKAKTKPTEIPNVIKVSFFPLFWAKYQVLYVDKEYQYAVVGSGGKYLWFLARNNTISSQQYKELEQIAIKYGYDPSTLHKTIQGEPPK